MITHLDFILELTFNKYATGMMCEFRNNKIGKTEKKSF